MMQSENRLREFIREVLETNGAVVESSGEDSMEALLPPELSRRTSFREHEKFYFNSERAADDGKVITFQTGLLESFGPFFQDRGLLAHLAMPKGYLKSAGFQEALEERITLRNGVFRFQHSIEKRISYLFVNFLYTAVSEDKKEGIFQQGINEYTLAGCDWPRAADAMAAEETHEWEERHSPEESLKRICALAKSKARTVLTDFTKKLNHHLNRDIRRLHEYYETIAGEIQKKIDKKGLAGPEKEKELSRIEATRGESRRKILDQRDRYKLRIELRPVNAARLIAPVAVISASVHRKKNSRQVEFIWNPYQKKVEPLGCESCHAPSCSFTLCDDRAHMLCDACAKCGGAAKFHCGVCFPGKRRAQPRP